MPCVCVYQETPSDDVVAKTEIADGLLPVLASSNGVSDVKSLMAVGQICGIHKDGQLDVLWADGSRSTTYPHQLYVVTDEVFS